MVESLGLYNELLFQSNSTSQNVNNNNTGSNAVTNNSAQTGSNKSWELSDYELHRIPQEALTDGSEIAVSPRALHSELMCPICLDMLHQTMTTKGINIFRWNHHGDSMREEMMVMS